MNILQYQERLQAHNWNYQQEQNPAKWKAGHKEYHKLIELSHTSRELRAEFKRYKTLKGVSQ